MYKLTTKNVLLIFLAIIIIAIAFRFFSIMTFPDSSTVLEKGEPLQIYPKQSISQTFVANRDGLNKIEFLFRTPGIKAGDTMNVTLSDATCKNNLSRGALEVPFLNSDNLYVFRFPRVGDSNGKKYCTIISYQTTNKTKYLRLFTTSNNNSETVLTLGSGEVAKNQSLSMRLVYNNDTVWQDLYELNQRMSQYKPWFLKHFYIATIGILSVILSIVLITALITLKIEDRDNERDSR